MAFNLLKTKSMQEWAAIFRKEGFKGIIKKKGLKILLLFIFAYLIRDTFLYIIIPYLIMKGIICR